VMGCFDWSRFGAVATLEEKERIRSSTTLQTDKTNAILKTLNDLIKSRLLLAYLTCAEKVATDAPFPTPAKEPPKQMKDDSNLLVSTIYER